MKKKILIWIAAVCLCQMVVLIHEDTERGTATNIDLRKVQELTWFCDESYWMPEAWDISTTSGTGRITEQTGVSIQYVIPEDNGDGRLSLMIVNNNIPDIISVSDKKMAKYLIESDNVWDLEELFETWLPDSHLLSDYPEDVKALLVERDGGWYGLTSDLRSSQNQTRYGWREEGFQEIVSQGSRYGIIWNRELLRRLGLSAGGLRTEEEILAAFETILERETMVNGYEVIPVLVDGNRYLKTTLPVLYDSFGASWEDSEGQYRERLLSEECGHALEFLNRLVRANYLDPEQFTMNAYNVTRTLNSGRVLCFIGDISRSGIDPKQWISAGAILSSEGSRPVQGRYTGVGYGEMTTFVSKSCKDPQAAARWLDYMTSVEGMAAYLVSGNEEWWPLLDADWYFSAARLSPEEEKAWQQLLCAFARMPETVTFDIMKIRSLSDHPSVLDLETAVRQCEKNSIAAMLMAESEEEFDSAYAGFLHDLAEAGIYELQREKRAIPEK